MLKRKKPVDITGTTETAKKVKAQVDYSEKLKSFFAVKASIKNLKAQEDKLKKELDKLYEGLTADSKGHRYIYGVGDDGNKLCLAKQARISVSLSPEKSRTFFEEKGLVERVFKTRQEEYIDEDEIAEMVKNEEITMQELEGISEKKVTYAITFVKEEETEENE